MSWRLNFSLQKAFPYKKPNAETPPAIAPASIAKPGFTIKSHAAPYITPPASVAFKSTSISILPFTVRLIYVATRTLPKILTKVLIAARCCCYPVPRAALKLGQYRKRKIVPIMEISSEL